jgi:hypothetical protein
MAGHSIGAVRYNCGMASKNAGICSCVVLPALGVLFGALVSGCPAEDAPPECASVQQTQGSPSGLERCGFSLYRGMAIACASMSTPRACDASDLGNGTCTSDAACSEGERCLAGVGDACECARPCTTDDECGEGFACACALEEGEVSRCVPADCRSDADCDGEARCEIDRECVYGRTGRLACHGEADECRGTFDCDGGTCRFDVDEARWRCLDDCVH